MVRNEFEILFSNISVAGFKSIRDHLEIDLRPLTILAGPNSSGKSSLLQPLLLLKQTFEAPYDRGPLLISGPNVTFPSVAEMLWQNNKGQAKDAFSVGLKGEGEVSRKSSERTLLGVEIEFQGLTKGFLSSFEIASCQWLEGNQAYRLKPTMTADEIHAIIPERLGKPLEHMRSFITDTIDLKVIRNRSVLGLNMPGDEGDIPLAGPWHTFMPKVADILHVPGLRGSPLSTYDIGRLEIDDPLSKEKVKYLFPGVFQHYFATVIAHWQDSQPDQLVQIGRDLAVLDLTDRIAVQKVSDSQVELYVGRSHPQEINRDGLHSLVNKTNVGFGVSQVLPVAVSLLAASPGQMVYLEQPELHLHPKAQVALAELLMRAVNRGVQVVVETHSEMLLRGVQRLVAKQDLNPMSVKLHWFTLNEDGATQVVGADLDNDGAFGDWPVDFADVTMQVIDDYLDIITVKHANGHS